MRPALRLHQRRRQAPKPDAQPASRSLGHIVGLPIDPFVPAKEDYCSEVRLTGCIRLSMHPYTTSVDRPSDEVSEQYHLVESAQAEQATTFSDKWSQNGP